MNKNTSIINTEPAPEWRVTVFRDKELGLRFAPGLAGTPVSSRPSFADVIPAFRYTWERCALSVLGEVTWSYDEDGDPAVMFVRDGIRTEVVSWCLPNGDRLWGTMLQRRAEEYADPVAALVGAALEALRRRL